MWEVARPPPGPGAWGPAPVLVRRPRSVARRSLLGGSSSATLCLLLLPAPPLAAESRTFTWLPPAPPRARLTCPAVSPVLPLAFPPSLPSLPPPLPPPNSPPTLSNTLCHFLVFHPPPPRHPLPPPNKDINFHLFQQLVPAGSIWVPPSFSPPSSELLLRSQSLSHPFPFPSFLLSPFTCRDPSPSLLSTNISSSPP